MKRSRMIKAFMDPMDRKHIPVMLFGLLVLMVFLILKKNINVMNDNIARIENLERENEYITVRLIETDSMILELEAEDIRQQRVLDYYQEILTEQAQWNDTRKNLSNEGLHLLIQDILKESLED